MACYPLLNLSLSKMRIFFLELQESYEFQDELNLNLFPQNILLEHILTSNFVLAPSSMEEGAKGP